MPPQSAPAQPRPCFRCESDCVRTRKQLSWFDDDDALSAKVATNGPVRSDSDESENAGLRAGEGDPSAPATEPRCADPAGTDDTENTRDRETVGGRMNAGVCVNEALSISRSDGAKVEDPPNGSVSAK
jgi:hypothetical protein